LVVFTASFPYTEAVEGTFIGAELPYLQERFDRIIVVPASRGGDREIVSSQILIDDGYAVLRPNALLPASVVRAPRNPILYGELRRRPATLFQPTAAGKLLRCTGNAIAGARWLELAAKRWRIDPRRTLFYSYWLSVATLAAAHFTRRHGGRLISRAHGGDLFHERHRPPYIPCQAAMLGGLDGLFLACNAAQAYVRDRFPDIPLRTEVWHLGVPQPPAPNPGPDDSRVCRIVSCAFLTEVKRVDLLLAGLASFARSHATRRIDWHHFGGGPLENQLQQHAREILPGSVTCSWHGSVSNDTIHDFYRTHHVDAFVTTTQSEGGVPVSIMEAQSYGIPVIAPAVGGIPDIVSPSVNGFLLTANPSPQEVAGAIRRLTAPPTESMRRASREVAATRFNAAVNFRTFAERIRALLDEPVTAIPPHFSNAAPPA
jgi:glycosyltransferase involved in cell wall biosynthesis